MTLARTVVALVILASLASPQASLSQTIENEISQVSVRLDNARAEQVDLISPTHYSEAAKKLGEAQRQFSRGGKIDDIRKLLSEARRSIERAEGYVEVGTVLLRDAIESRGAAAEANAPEFASRDWEEAEEQLLEAGKRVEKGDQNGTRERASRAERAFRTAELKAIRADVLGKTRDARSAAVKAEAPKWSSATFADAEALLNRAESELKENRYDRSVARELAEEASSQFTRAARIARTARKVDDDVRTTVEPLMLEYEAHIAAVAEKLNRSPDFAEGAEPAIAEIVSSIQSLYDDRTNLEEELARKNAEIDRLINVDLQRMKELADSLDTRLALLEQRERAVLAELQVREEKDAKIDRIKSTFEKDEAEVLISGNQMIVRLYGLQFPVGSAEIRPANFGLLTKVQRVLREFPSSPVVIAGHTDSQGYDATNLSLSKRRADAVREYLLANMSTSAERITAAGYGESQPIASNETSAGRAQNRRIDVILSLSGEPLSGL
ncbi:MAG: OmpA family protein [Rhodothermia bacterium]|nr:OmpA family protein [Rhodothermia bacterium]